MIKISHRNKLDSLSTQNQSFNFSLEQHEDALSSLRRLSHIVTNLRSYIVDATLKTEDEGRPDRRPMSSTCEQKDAVRRPHVATLELDHDIDARLGTNRD